MATSRKKRVYSKKLKYTIKIAKRAKNSTGKSERTLSELSQSMTLKKTHKNSSCQNKHQVWKYNQGITNFCVLKNYKYYYRIYLVCNGICDILDTWEK